MRELKVGLKGSAQCEVVRENTAAAVGSGALEVFSTPSMVALMEKVALESVQPFLEEGQGTVGTRLEISHLTATPVGMTVRAESELVEIDRRKLSFRVSAWAGEEKIGEGLHQRFIICNDSFLEKTRAKLNKD